MAARRLLSLLLLCVAPLAAAEPLSGTAARETLDRVRRLFESARFTEAREECERLLADPRYPPPAATPAAEILRRHAEQEEAMFFSARCGLALAATEAESASVAEAFLALADNRKKFEEPAFDREARFYAGQALLGAGKPEAAATVFRRLQELGPPAALDLQACRGLADALLLQARRQEIEADAAADPTRRSEHERRRDTLLGEAAAELNRISTHYPGLEGHGAAELLLIELRVRLGDYREAGLLAEAYARRETERDADRARARMFQSECHYRLGEIEEATAGFAAVIEKERPDPATRAAALCGFGASRMRQAAGLDPEQRAAAFRAARDALEEAIRLMPASEARRHEAACLRAEACLALGDAAGAVETLRPLLEGARTSSRALGLAARAAAEAGNAQEAAGLYVETARRCRTRQDAAGELDARKALASLELKHGDPRLAVRLLRPLATTAETVREKATAAAAALTLACACLEAARASTARAPLLAADAIAEFAPDSAPEPSPEALLDEAVSRLRLLASRTDGRVRGDELGVLLGEALLARAELDASAGRDRGAILARYQAASAALREAVRRNPIGDFAAPAEVALGRAFAGEGRVRFAEAAELRAQGDPAEALIRDAEGKRVLALAQEAFAGAVVAPRIDPALRVAAQLALADVHAELEEWAEAARNYVAICGAPDLGNAVRLAAARGAGTALEKLGDREGAVRQLQPWIETDLPAALHAGRLLEAEGQFGEAAAVWRRGLLAPGAKEDGSRAETMFRLHALELSRVGEGEAAEAVRAEAERELERLVRTWPELAWAPRALLVLGRDLIARNRAREAEALAVGTLRDNAARKPFLQAAELLSGLALAAEGKAAEALEALARAEAIDPTEADMRLRRAEAGRRRGEIERDRGRTEEALGHFMRVIARDPEFHAETDLCRIAAADLYAARGETGRGLRVLEGGADREAMQAARDRLRRRSPP